MGGFHKEVKRGDKNGAPHGIGRSYHTWSSDCILFDRVLVYSGLNVKTKYPEFSSHKAVIMREFPVEVANSVNRYSC